MINNNLKVTSKIKIGMFLLMGILLIFSVSAASRSTTQYLPPTSSSNYLNSHGISLTNSFSKDSCEAGQDFVVQISPLGCTPTVVRSDLLEEQNVPVFCQLAATKINPLIDVEAIESISFKGDYPKEVSGVGFHPANAGIKTSQSTLLNSPILNNIGYAVIILKKQPNESAMPDWVQGNMTAKIRYDVKNAFGIGQATYYLPQISDEAWALNYEQYGFWKGKGFLKAENIEKNSATISIYQNQNDKITSVSLTKGKTSGKVNVPGFYCLASLQLRLDGLVVPDTRAKFEISGETVEVIKGEKFLDNKCSVRSVDKKGSYQKVSVYCSTDNGGKNFDFKISPKVRLKIADIEKDYEIGQTIGNNVYVGYLSAKDISAGKVIDTKKKENLTVYFYKSETDLGEKLSDSKLSSIARSVESVLNKVNNLDTIPDVKKGELEGIYYGKEKIVFDKKINVIGFGGAQNVDFLSEEEKIKIEKDISDLYGGSQEDIKYASELENELLEKELNYNSAIETYDEIINSYSGMELSNDENLKIITYGENAFYEKIVLTDEVGQKASVAIFCDKFRERYPVSKYLNDVEKICSESSLANSESASWDVLINGVVNNIRFEGISEPSEKEYSAEVSVGNKDYVLTKDEVVESEDKSSYSVQLISLDDDYAEVKVIVSSLEYNGTKIFKLKEDVLESFGNKKIVLRKINLKKLAKVSVIPSIDNVGTDADFTFKIGIEKRAIQLSPEKTIEKIKNLNETIEKWEGISENLGKVVKGMKAACLGTSAFLTAKNFFSGFKGKAGARQEVTEMYRTKCKSEGKGGEELQACLLDYNDNINNDIEKLAVANTNRDKLRDNLVDGYEKGEDNKMVLKDSEKSILKGIGEGKESKGLLEEDNYKTELINLIRLQELRDEKLISDEEFKKESEIIWKGIDDDYEYSNLGQSAIKEWRNNGAEDMTVQSAMLKDQKLISYTGAIDSGKLGIGSSSESVSVQGLRHNNEIYILGLKAMGNNKYSIINVYNKDGTKLDETNDTTLISEIKKTYSVEKADETSYNNKYENYQAIYYESMEYKGLPKVVPVDTDKGFYAFTSTGSGKMDAYGDSAMPSYFYLCNVMGNHKEEAMGGDDRCVGVRVGSNSADGALEGLSLAETNNWARKSITVLRDVSRQYKAGVTQVTINGQRIPVGNPSYGAGTECVDFMSPEDCALLFNVCDPVVCPESRCDLGGKYRVSNVIQSGIIGGILLCLPNFGSPSEGGVVIPVCLTGINAGIESLVSIYKNYGDCLQHSLDTGETVGICDEIHSIYLCEFFWKQAVPFIDLTLPTAIEFLLTGGRGGGEYMNVQGAWDAAGKSVDYLTNYYGANAYAAFKVRATDEVGSAVCRNFISARYPASGDFFDALIEPDSPSQYSGWFHEITFTTATAPPTSQYKVFYHIYAGKDAGVYYDVYLKSPTGSSFYADAPRIDVASGYIERGGYASETKDMLEVSGYKEMCINVQGQEECGFKEVSTSFALNYVQDEYVKDQAERTDIKSEKECISGSASLYSMATPNIQAGVEGVIDAQIYNQGIVRVCATNNPGEATDNERWVNVGTCGGNINCWIDTESVGESVVFNESLEGLEDVTENALEKLREEGKYLSEAEFEELLDEIKEADNNEKINLINNALSDKSEKKIFFNEEKVKLLWLKAKAYVSLVMKKIQEEGVESEKSIPDKNDDEGLVSDAPNGDDKVKNEDKKEIGFKDRTRKEVLEAIKTLYPDCNDYVQLLYSGDTYLYEGVDPLLLIAIMQQESECDQGAEHSDKTSFGLMGITKDAFEDICEGKKGLLFFDDVKGSGKANNNIKCGIMVLEKRYDLYSRGFTFKKAESGKTTSCSRIEDKIYSGWEAALRGYNGWGCGNDNYVEEVIKIYNSINNVEVKGEAEEEGGDIQAKELGADD